MKPDNEILLRDEAFFRSSETLRGLVRLADALSARCTVGTADGAEAFLDAVHGPDGAAVLPSRDDLAIAYGNLQRVPLYIQGLAALAVLGPERYGPDPSPETIAALRPLARNLDSIYGSFTDGLGAAAERQATWWAAQDPDAPDPIVSELSDFAQARLMIARAVAPFDRFAGQDIKMNIEHQIAELDALRAARPDEADAVRAQYRR